MRHSCSSTGFQSGYSEGRSGHLFEILVPTCKRPKSRVPRILDIIHLFRAITGSLQLRPWGLWVSGVYEAIRPPPHSGYDAPNVLRSWPCVTGGGVQRGGGGGAGVSLPSRRPRRCVWHCARSL